MHGVSNTNYFFLNRNSRWPRFHRSGIEIRADGALQLASLPQNRSAPLITVQPPAAPAGIAVDVTGTVYFTVPDDNRVMRIDGCDGSIAPAPCMGGRSSQPTQFCAPRGLLIPNRRRVLMVADSGNHRIEIFDLETNQLVEIWGQTQPGALPVPSTLPGKFDTPWAIDEDAAGSCYVVDWGNRRVQKFNFGGDVVPSFGDNVAASGLLQQPSDIAVRVQNGETWIFIVDAASATILIFDGEGRPVLDAQGRPRTIANSAMRRPMGIAVVGSSLYVGDNATPGVLRFAIDDAISLAGVAIGYKSPVAALRSAGSSALWVHPGDSLPPQSLAASGGFAASGVLWSDPIEMIGRTVVWHRVLALVEPLAESAHLDLYAYASNNLADAPLVNPSTVNPFADQRWQSIVLGANLDVTDLYIGGQQSKYLWIGAVFGGDGTVSPIVRQLRIEFDYPSYDRYLPAAYRQKQCGNEFLSRMLSLFESMYANVEHEITSLPALFDPKAAPARFLPWLAACLGLELDNNWSEHKQRSVIAEIFRLSGRRGTVAGLRDALHIFAGVDAIIEEPIINAAWWSMPAGICCDACTAEAAVPSQQGNSILGWTTMLPPAQPNGAVIGSSADLDQSHLITDDQFGAPLFGDLAYRFGVQIYRSQAMNDATVAKIRAILDQEKPAHTLYHLSIIEPRLRVGFQSRVGVDTVVGGPPRSLALDTGQRLGEDTALAGAAASRLGVKSQLGVNMRLA